MDRSGWLAERRRYTLRAWGALIRDKEGKRKTNWESHGSGRFQEKMDLEKMLHIKNISTRRLKMAV